MLKVNVRAAADPVWSEFVAGVGRGSPARFPDSCMVADENALIAAVWPNGNFLVNGLRSILTMTRKDATTINNQVIEMFPGLSDYALSLDAALVSGCARIMTALN
jgi:hypothetical protein